MVRGFFALARARCARAEYGRAIFAVGEVLSIGVSFARNEEIAEMLFWASSKCTHSQEELRRIVLSGEVDRRVDALLGACKVIVKYMESANLPIQKEYSMTLPCVDPTKNSPSKVEMLEDGNEKENRMKASVMRVEENGKHSNSSMKDTLMRIILGERSSGRVRSAYDHDGGLFAAALRAKEKMEEGVGQLVLEESSGAEREKSGGEEGSGEAVVTAVLVYLCCGSEEEFKELVRSVHLVDRHFTRLHPYPVKIFHEGFTEGEMQRIRDVAPHTDLHFVHIVFELPSFIDASSVPAQVGPYKVGYRHMCRFFSKTLFERPEVADYDIIWRVDSDSYLYDDVVEDLPLSLVRSGKSYAFMGSFRDNGLYTVGLHDTTMRFLEERYGDKDPLGEDSEEEVDASGVVPPISLMRQRHEEWNMRYMGRGQAGEWDDICFHTHFTLMRRDLWDRPGIKEYLDAIDRDGGIFRHRWGDACIHYLAVTLFVDASEVWHVTSLPYWHQLLIHRSPGSKEGDPVVSLTDTLPVREE